MSFDEARWRRRARRRVHGIGDLERILWGVVVLALIGDVATTFAGLHLGLSESNPVARGAIDAYGVWGMLALKTLALCVALACRPLLTDRWGPVVPAGLALPWLAAIVINCYVIATIL